MNWQAKAREWAAQHYTTDLCCARGLDRRHTPACSAFRECYLAAVRATLAVAATRADDEPELPGDPSLESIAQVLQYPVDAMRAAVRSTKKDIAIAIRALMPEETP